MTTLAVLMGLIDGASEVGLEVLLPPPERRDISCAFAVDYGTPSHKRRVLREKARQAWRKGRTQQLHEDWMKRLSAAGTKAMRAGRPMPANVK